MFKPQGLSEVEVLSRRQAGQGNDAVLGHSRSYWDIARANLFTFFNNILFVIGVALIALGEVNDAVTSVGLAVINAIIGTVQEIRAKRQLEAISLLTRTTATVRRDGQEKPIDPAELVVGDVILVQAGDQIVVDGVMVGEGRLEMDEALLTGESDLIAKQPGDALLSGSYCVTGRAYYQVEKVGMDSFANQLTQTARGFQLVQTPLQKQINFVVRLIMLVVAVMSLIILLTVILDNLGFTRIVEIAAVLTGQVPYGLFFMIVVAYSLSAAAISTKGALVQQVNAVESLSNIDVLCMDKTGTLTANRLEFSEIVPVCGREFTAVSRRLSEFVQSNSAGNRTSDALATALPGIPRPIADEVPFASSRKWSGLVFADGEQPGAYVLGAPEILASALPTDTLAVGSAMDQQIRVWADEGLRVLLFAYSPETTHLHNALNQPYLPPLTPLALVSLKDELRPQAQEALSAFTQMGIHLKIISGDSPQTVMALARQVGLAEVQAISGAELAELTVAEFDAAAENCTVFGRITPDQKEKLVSSLIDHGHYVAMIGDGVNDVLSLKKAQLGVVMQSGSSAARHVADMVLLNDSFAALQPAFAEGKRVISGMTNTIFLFLARVMTSIFIIVAISMIGLGFPFEPSQVALTLFTVGIPTFFLTLWARPQNENDHLFRQLARFVIPIAVVTMFFGLALYTAFYTRVSHDLSAFVVPPQVIRTFEAFTGLTYNVDDNFGAAAATIVAQTILSDFISIAAFILILFLEPPMAFFTGWVATPSPDKRPAWLALALFAVFMIVINNANLAGYFGLLMPSPPVYMALAVAVPLWFFTLRTIWRGRLFERLLGVNEL
jgi:cation-transporting ATPase E